MSTAPARAAAPGTPSAAGREITGRTLRGMLGAAAFGLMLAAILTIEDARFGPAAVVVGLIAAVAVTMFPSSPAPMVVGVAAIILVVADDPGMSFWVVLTAALLHTMHVLAGLADVIPTRARIEFLALAPSFRRWVRTQAVTVPVLAIVAIFL